MSCQQAGTYPLTHTYVTYTIVTSEDKQLRRDAHLVPLSAAGQCQQRTYAMHELCQPWYRDLGYSQVNETDDVIQGCWRKEYHPWKGG